MVDLIGQYERIKDEIDAGVQEVIDSGAFINGDKVEVFARQLALYCGVKNVIPCGNGTDALQISLMSLGLKRGDEVIVPSFTYAASAEAIALLGLTPVLVDVDSNTFNVTLSNIEKGFSSKTKAIIPVHLFGQSCDMADIMEFAVHNSLYVIEDNAQSIGAKYTFDDGSSKYTGTIGHIGCTSFFPSKNLGCFGDGGATMTDNDQLAERIRMIANHGQKVKYHHEIIGCNSRLDTIQAAILSIKLKYLDMYSQKRNEAARYYNGNLKDTEGIILPEESAFSTHVYHQYTLKVKAGKRDALKSYLESFGIPTMIYYPLPLHEQKAYRNIARVAEELKVSVELSDTVLSLPLHTELSHVQQDFIIGKIRDFFKKGI